MVQAAALLALQSTSSSTLALLLFAAEIRTPGAGVFFCPQLGFDTCSRHTDLWLISIPRALLQHRHIIRAQKLPFSHSSHTSRRRRLQIHSNHPPGLLS